MKKHEYLLTASEEKRIAKEHFRKRVLQAQDKLINSQLSLALGSHVLFRIDYDPDTGRKSKPQMVTDPEEIQAYLAGEVTDNSSYHFFLQEKPDNRAIDSLFDRAFGKPQTPTEDQPDASVDIGVIAYPTLPPDTQALNTPLTTPSTTPLSTISNTLEHDQISLETSTDTGTGSPITG